MRTKVNWKQRITICILTFTLSHQKPNQVRQLWSLNWRMSRTLLFGLYAHQISVHFHSRLHNLKIYLIFFVIRETIKIALNLRNSVQPNLDPVHVLLSNTIFEHSLIGILVKFVKVWKHKNFLSKPYTALNCTT